MDALFCVPPDGVLRLPGGGRHVAVLRGGRDAPLAILVEDEHGGTPLQARVAALAGPVAVARLTQGNVAVGVVLAKGCGGNKRNQAEAELKEK